MKKKGMKGDMKKEKEEKRKRGKGRGNEGYISYIEHGKERKDTSMSEEATFKHIARTIVNPQTRGILSNNRKNDIETMRLLIRMKETTTRPTL